MPHAFPLPMDTQFAELVEIEKMLHKIEHVMPCALHWILDANSRSQYRESLIIE